MKLHILRCYQIFGRYSTCRHVFGRAPHLTQVSNYSYSKEPPVDAELVEKLERLSLVAFDSEVGVQRLQQTIKLANKVLSVDTTGVQPMVYVHDDRPLHLRPDDVNEGNDKEAVLSNATKSFEDYYIAPPGNIPLKRS